MQIMRFCRHFDLVAKYAFSQALSCTNFMLPGSASDSRTRPSIFSFLCSSGPKQGIEFDMVPLILNSDSQEQYHDIQHPSSSQSLLDGISIAFFLLLLGFFILPPCFFFVPFLFWSFDLFFADLILCNLWIQLFSKQSHNSGQKVMPKKPAYPIQTSYIENSCLG